MAGYSYVPQLNYNTMPKVHHTSTSYVYDNYCASTTNSRVDVARYNDSMHVASASHYSDNSFYYTHHNFKNCIRLLKLIGFYFACCCTSKREKKSVGH